MKRFFSILVAALLCFSLVACDLNDLFGTAPEATPALSLQAYTEQGSTLEIRLNTSSTLEGESIILSNKTDSAFSSESIVSDGTVFYYYVSPDQEGSTLEGSLATKLTDSENIRVEEKDGVKHYFYSDGDTEYELKAYSFDSDKLGKIEGDSTTEFKYVITEPSGFGTSTAITVSGNGTSALLTSTASAYSNSLKLDDTTHTLNLLPASFAATEDGKIDANAILSVPFYGADGRVSEMIPVAATGAASDGTFRPDGSLGLRAVGAAENGNFTEIYAFIVDLSFRSATDGATISLCTDDGTAFSVPLDDTVDQSILLDLLGALRIVFFDTDTLTILNTTSLAAQQARLTEDSLVAQLSDGGIPLALTQANAGENYNVSMLVYIDRKSVV